MTIPLPPIPLLPDNVVVWGNDENHQIRGRPRNEIFTGLAPGGATQGLVLRAGGIPVLWGGVGAAAPGKPIVPGLVLAPGQTYTAIAIGVSFAAGIRASDQWIDTWGDFALGAPSALPTKHARRKFIDLTVGGGFGLAITTDNVLVQWGAGEDAQPNSPDTTFVEVRARSGYCVARDVNGNLYGWGGNLFSPPAVPHPLDSTGWQFVSNAYWFHPGSFTAIAAGLPSPTDPFAHVLALKSDGTVVGWGSNTLGAISNAPQGVNFIDVAAGKSFSIGLDASYQLHHWGNPMRVAVSSPTSPTLPGLLETVPVGRFRSISAGSTHATALRAL